MWGGAGGERMGGEAGGSRVGGRGGEGGSEVEVYWWVRGI